MSDQIREFVHFQKDEGATQQECNEQPTKGSCLLLSLSTQHGKAIGNGREQQDSCFDLNILKIEKLLTGRATSKLMRQDCKNGEQRPEDDAVRHQVNPEAEHDRAFLVLMLLVMSWGRVSGVMRHNNHRLPYSAA